MIGAVQMDEMKAAENSSGICSHNRMIICDTYKCSTCGWNPAVSEKRKIKIRRSLKIKLPVFQYGEQIGI